MHILPLSTNIDYLRTIACREIFEIRLDYKMTTLEVELHLVNLDLILVHVHCI